jgi:hypothetical protein
MKESGRDLIQAIVPAFARSNSGRSGKIYHDSRIQAEIWPGTS